MKKLLTVVFAMLLAAGLTFAQDTGGDKGVTTGGTPKPASTAPAASGKKATKTSKAHKGGKKSKKGSSTTTTPPK